MKTLSTLFYLRCFTLIFVLLSLLSCKSAADQGRYKVLKCDQENALTVLHFVSLQNCPACGPTLQVPKEYGEYLSQNCSYVIANHKVLNYQQLLQNHLPKAILDNSQVFADHELFSTYRNTYMPHTGSFVLVFKGDSLVKKSEIGRSAITKVFELMSN